ncbi:MAG: hypothetical protein LCH61_04490 [Proteobacteria bacterium]|nr:hypothetical protein [Pseudomonadota bacterium]
MADETSHLLDAAQALNGKLCDKPMNPENVAKDDPDMIPEDVTEVPDIREMTAIRGDRSKSRQQDG